jgi:sn-glycerol 3-phosphate transport system substrate-binding protein
VSERRLFLRGVAATVGATLLGCRRPPAHDRVEASLWFTYGGRNREVLEALVDRFNEMQSRYYVRAVFQGDYFEGLAKLRTAMAARAGPTFSHVIGEVVPYLARTGVLEPLGNYPGARELDLIPALAQTGSWVEGDRQPLVCLPFNRSTPIAYLNGERLTEAGAKPPQTWAEHRELARRLSGKERGKTRRYGFGCPVSWWFWVALTGQAGGTVIEPDGTVSLGGAAGVEAVEWWQALVHEDQSMKRPPGRDYNAWEATNQDFLAGRTAIIWTSTAFLKYLEDTASFPVVAAPLPAHRRRAVPTGGTHWIVLRDAPVPAKQAAWTFLRWLLEPQQVIEWATATGYMPVTRRAIEALERDGYYDRHPNDRVAYDQLDVALPWPWSPWLIRIQREVVQPRLERAVLSRGAAAPLLEEARQLARKAVGP